MSKENITHTCPYCKEDIKPDAIKCKHCGSKITSSLPSHEGTCPYCKEDIKPEATKCKHCKSNLVAQSDCGCGNDDENQYMMAMRALSILEPHGPYQDCYLDCSFDYPEGSLGQNLCFKRCDRRKNYGDSLLAYKASLSRG